MSRLTQFPGGAVEFEQITVQPVTDLADGLSGGLPELPAITELHQHPPPMVGTKTIRHRSLQ